MSTEKSNRPSNMTAEDQAALSAAGDAYNNAKTDDERVAAHAQAEAIRSKYNYSGGADGSQHISTNNSEDDARQQSYVDVYQAANKVNDTGLSDAALNALKNSNTAQVPQVKPQQPFTAPVPDFTGLLDKWLESAKTQQQTAIDYATNKGVADLERAEEEAQEQFQTQQNQISENEAKALDNQALYAEARGDRGGIGQAQYGQIQATAMTNRRAVNSARTKLSTDTARAIADLRAQGEFEKADALLQLTQTYLGQLIELQQWGAEYTMDVSQFNAQLQQWQAEFNLQAQKYSDSLNQWQMEWDYAVSQNERETLAKSGAAALSVGIRPSAAQQQAMGYTDAQIDAELAAYKLAQTSGVKVSSGGGGNGNSNGGGNGNDNGGGNGGSGSAWDDVEAWVDKFGEDSAENYIKEHYKDLGYSSQSAALAGWQNYLLSSEADRAAESKQDYPAVLNELSKLEDSKFADAVKIKKIIDLIEKANKAGRITDEQAEKLLTQYGL